MMIVLRIERSGTCIFSYAFPGGDREKVPEYMKEALIAFFGERPDYSLLDAGVILRLDVSDDDVTAA